MQGDCITRGINSNCKSSIHLPSLPLPLLPLDLSISNTFEGERGLIEIGGLFEGGGGA